ncbi:MAG: glycosyltransferase family 39 protein [Anaerolineales bacterium]|nr:glycosyltransferase family 39 protein [Anaerolineales bacterium]
MVNSIRRRDIPALLILWLALALRLYRLDFQSIWWDEGHSIFVASHPITAIPTLPAMDVHPPAYFSLLHLWLALAGRSEFALRYLSVVFSLLTVALLWRLARLLARSMPPPTHSIWPSRLTGLLAAVSPLYVAYAQEVRSYAMITCLALASTFVLWRLLLPDHRRDTGRKRGELLGLYILLTAACLYTHYFTIFLLLFQNIFWFIWLLRGKFIHHYQTKTMAVHAALWAASQVAIGLLFAPQLLLATRQITGYTNPNLTPPTLIDFISRSWQAYTTGLTIDPGPARWGMGLAAVVLGVSWAIQFAANRPRPILPFTLLLLWFIVPLAAYFIILQRQPSFEPRYLILITPSLFLLLGLGCGGPIPISKSPHSPAASHGPRPTPYVLSGLLLLILTLSLYSYYTNETYFKDDSAGVANWLAQETTANDIVYIDVPHPFHYYAERAAIPAPVHYLFVDIHTAADQLNQEAAGRDRLFWVAWRGSDTDPRGVIPFLAEKAGTFAGQRDFRGYQVRWFDLPAEAKFSLPDQLAPVQATFGDVLRLDGLAFGDTTTPVEPVWATLHFTLLRDTDVNYKVSLRLRAGDGAIVGQVDRDLLNDRHFRTADWPLADPTLNQATSVYLLPLPVDLAAGRYRLEAVIYNAEPPYPSEGVAGLETADGVSALLGHVKVVP